MANLLKGLKAIILERFAPASYGPMILVFTLMNGMYFVSAHNLTPTAVNSIFALLLMASSFFRLRLFDEIKDYAVDIKINPTRPLARAVISIDQVKLIIGFLIVLELGVAARMGATGFLVHVLGMAYSLLMFEEFFIGKILRPHLTTYAVTHTFVSVLFAISGAFQFAGGQGFTSLTLADYLFFLSNWFYFNLFEFARKSFSKDEERAGVDTYSSLFGPKGAGLLSLSQAIAGEVFATQWQSGTPKVLSYLLLIIYVLVTAAYMLKPQQKVATLFRNVSGIFLIAQYSLTILYYWR